VLAGGSGEETARSLVSATLRKRSCRGRSRTICWIDEQSVMSAVYMKVPELFTTVDCSSRLREIGCHDVVDRESDGIPTDRGIEMLGA